MNHKKYVGHRILYAKLAADLNITEQHARNIILCTDNRKASVPLAEIAEIRTGIPKATWLSGNSELIIEALISRSHVEATVRS